MGMIEGEINQTIAVIGQAAAKPRKRYTLYRIEGRKAP